MMTNHRDYEHMLFYFAYKTFINRADEIIEQSGMNRQHHRFLFFINKLPGITIKQLLAVLDISKQGSHATLKTLKEKKLIIEQPNPDDMRVKQLFITDEGHELVEQLNSAQNDLLRQIFSEGDNDWYRIMEELADHREGFRDIKHLIKEDNH
ncbi:MarR family winged helix-turn-helix transcriptional regulator [Staphylococcus kloosii]|uniref:MarR family winged helix-turn-helix transcriptional regulator n=1 Tax=Staphylococcus kloosii TaxID=29384 RepID=UPI003983A6BC